MIQVLSKGKLLFLVALIATIAFGVIFGTVVAKLSSGDHSANLKNLSYQRATELVVDAEEDARISQERLKTSAEIRQHWEDELKQAKGTDDRKTKRDKVAEWIADEKDARQELEASKKRYAAAVNAKEAARQREESAKMGKK